MQPVFQASNGAESHFGCAIIPPRPVRHKFALFSYCFYCNRMNIIKSIIGIARAKQYLQGLLQDAIFKDHPPMGMVKLSCCISRSHPGVIMAKAEGDKL